MNCDYLQTDLKMTFHCRVKIPVSAKKRFAKLKESLLIAERNALEQFAAMQKEMKEPGGKRDDRDLQYTTWNAPKATGGSKELAQYENDDPLGLIKFLDDNKLE